MLWIREIPHCQHSRPPYQNTAPFLEPKSKMRRLMAGHRKRTMTPHQSSRILLPDLMTVHEQEVCSPNIYSATAWYGTPRPPFSSSSAGRKTGRRNRFCSFDVYQKVLGVARMKLQHLQRAKIAFAVRRYHTTDKNEYLQAAGW